MKQEDFTPQRVVDITETLAHVHGAAYAKRAELAATVMALIGSLDLAIKSGDQAICLLMSELVASTCFKVLPEIAGVSAADFKTASIARAADSDDLAVKVRKALSK